MTYTATPQVMVERMASPKAIQMMTEALTKAVEKGTAKSIFTPNLKMAGMVLWCSLRLRDKQHLVN